MPDRLTPEQRRLAMQRVKTKDGPLEVAVRSALWKRGYRFRKHVKGLPGSPDVVFTRRKVAVFIDGDFWHGYDFEKWRDKLKPFWRDKIETNIARDERNYRSLEAQGWTVIRLWGHEVKKDLEGCTERIVTALSHYQHSK
jgi:DNA mismatch endonuclease (patch repair protein)